MPENTKFLILLRKRPLNFVPKNNYAICLLSKFADYAPFLIGFNIIFGSVIILIGTKINSETKEVDIEK